MTANSNMTLENNLDGLQAGGALRRELSNFTAVGVELVSENGQVLNLRVNGMPVYLPDEPVARCHREVDSFLENKTPDLVVFFGLGLGWHARRLREKMGNTQVPILIFEPSLDILARVLPEVDLNIEGVQLITNTGHLIEEAGKTLSPVRTQLAVGAIPSYRQIFSQEFELFCAALAQAGKKVTIDQETKSYFARDWMTHPRDNLPLLVKSNHFGALARKFSGKTGILVGAGPSLDDNIEVLKSAKGKALICAVHTAALPLAQKGITPDIVVILESHELEHFFQGIPDLDQIYLAPDPQTHPRHLELGFKGLLTITTSGNPSADWMQEAYGFEPLKSGGSVACAAFSLLHNLGCDPIILVGMDAAFSHGRTHAQQAQEGCCRVELDSQTGNIAYKYLDGRKDDGQWEGQLVEAWGGHQMVMTRPVYSSFRHWFEAASQTWAFDRNLINATEGGARFQGFREMKLSDALAEHGQGDIPASRWIKESLKETQAMNPQPLGKAIRSELDVARAAAKAAQKADQSAAKALRLLRSGQLSSLDPVLKKLGHDEKMLQGFTRKTRLLNSLVGYRAMALSQQPPASQDKISLAISSVEKSQEISRLVISGAAELESLYGPMAQEFQAGEAQTPG